VTRAGRGLLVVIAGPSGVGKGTVHARLRTLLPDSHLSVSATTRPPRPGEREGTDYRFVSTEEFNRLIHADQLLEWASYADNLYGTPRAAVEEAVAAGKVVLLDIEVQGALQVRQHHPDALLVFLEPPSFDELERRLESRGTEAGEELRRRLIRAREELLQAGEFDLRVVNDDLDACVDELLQAIQDTREGRFQAG